MVTIESRQATRGGQSVGSIEVGKDADLAIFDKYPLSGSAKVQKVLIDGTGVLRPR